MSFSVTTAVVLLVKIRYFGKYFSRLNVSIIDGVIRAVNVIGGFSRC